MTSGLGLFHLITSQRTNVLIRNLTVQRGRQSTWGSLPGRERAWKPSSTFHFDVLACRLVRPGLPVRRRCAHRGVGGQSEFAKAGALFCYGADLDLFRQVRAEEVIE